MRILFFLLIPFLSFSQTVTIEQVVDTWKTDKVLCNSTFAYCVLDAETGEVVKEYNSHISVIPASTLKVVTTTAALGILGKFYRYDTRIYFTGSFDKATGVLNGDIIIRGSGDPTLNSELFLNKKDTTDITYKWAEVLAKKGLKEVKGKIIGDASCYGQHIPANWIWGDISNYFGVAPCGLSFNDNLYSIIFESKETGSKANIIDIRPKYRNIILDHDDDVKAAGKEDDAYVTGDPFGNKKRVTGTIPPNKKELEVRAALPDPALLCAEFLETSLNKIGIITPSLCAKSNYDDENPDIKKEKLLMHTNYSSALEKIVFYTNLTSNNLFCETLLKTVGKGSDYAGIDKTKEYWKNKGLDVSELYMVDGNGLSRANTITTSFEANLLYKMYHDSVLFKPFYNSLPQAGLSGSMKSIGKGTFIEKNMRAKTGYINRARGYCGYVKTKAGKDLTFSVLFNNYNCNPTDMKVKIETFLVALADL
jgi:D-alanyl-D-alanine carboxypeptidase/D-alanyl-D-alanine-endopeptidase (penicillin-binding protein 4)